MKLQQQLCFRHKNIPQFEKNVWIKFSGNTDVQRKTSWIKAKKEALDKATSENYVLYSFSQPMPDLSDMVRITATDFDMEFSEEYTQATKM